MGPTSSGPRTFICCLRREISGADFAAAVYDAYDLGRRLGYAPAGPVVEIDPRREGPATTVLLALARTGADAVITQDLEHVDGIDRLIRDRAELITVEGERVLERAVVASVSRSA